MKNKLNIGVVFGGQSGEHEVSRVSAYNVLGVIDRSKYNIVTIGISKQGKWYLYSGDAEKIKDGSWEQDMNNSFYCQSRVYSTALNVLQLQVYYRYKRHQDAEKEKEKEKSSK